MSGIAGIIHFDGKPIEQGLIEKMTSVMTHRGPDGINHWVNGSVALGQCMLRTTPESLEEHQPLINEDGSLVLVMDGRVDNWEGLRHDLLGRGALLRDRSDAELVLRAYETWGDDCLQRIDGDFALAIWDARKQEAFCARDRMGNKPFYFWRSSQYLCFGSEFSALFSLPMIDAKLNLGLVAEFLSQDFFAIQDTIWSGIARISQGSYMRFSRNKVATNTYWTPGSMRKLTYPSDDDYIEHYRNLLFEQVRRSTRSYRTVAVEVSGGLDSSAVYASCKHLHEKGILESPEILGYTFNMAEEPDFDDTNYVLDIIDFFEEDIHYVKPFIDTYDGYRDRANKTMNFPGYPNGVMHLSIYQHVRTSGCNVLLNGVGGDEWQGGTRTYFSEELSSLQFATLASLCKQEIEAVGISEATRVALVDMVKKMFPSNIIAILQKVRLKYRESSKPEGLKLSPKLASLHSKRARESQLPKKTSKYWTLDQQRMLNYYLHPFRAFATEQTELFGSLSGIEIRNPLNSAAILDFAMTCPVRLRRRNTVDRFMHRKAMQGLLPTSVLERKGKADFNSIFRCSTKLLYNIQFPSKTVKDWLGIQSEELSQLWERSRTDIECSWMDWSVWSLFACSIMKEMAERRNTNVNHRNL